MTAIEDHPALLEDDAAGLAAAVLAGEAQRQEEQVARTWDGVFLPDDLLPGVGSAEMPLADVIRTGGKLTIAVLFGLGFVEYLDQSAFAVLTPDIQKSLHVSTGVMGVVAAMAGFTLFPSAIPLGAL